MPGILEERMVSFMMTIIVLNVSFDLLHLGIVDDTLDE